MRTNTLRELIKATLDEIPQLTQVYYKIADKDAMYPHAVLNLRNITMQNTDAHRKDYILEVDVWHNGSEADVLDICDTIEDALNMANMPFSDIYPTFYFENRMAVPDEDKNLKHYLIKFAVQLFQ